MKNLLTFVFISILVSQSPGIFGQDNVGINTETPAYELEMVGSGHQFMRLHHTSTVSPRVEVELLRGEQGDPGRDWKISKIGDDLRFYYSDDNFTTFGTSALRLNENGYMGIGLTNPQTRLHIASGENASNTEDGYIVLGTESSDNLVLDDNAILARHNGGPSALFLQGEGGHTYFGFYGLTNTIFKGNHVSVGGFSTGGKLNITDDLWQLQLNNWQTTQNNWFIGASNNTWLAGDNQLLFSPTSTSSAAVFRLMDVTDNNGEVAPVIIHSSEDQILLMDGNEIDTRVAPLYFNYNSENDVILNAQDGKVGIGTNNAHGKLHVRTDVGFDLALEHGTAKWQISAYTDANVYFWNNGLLRAYIHWNGGGAWVQASDRKLKENITELEGAMDLVKGIGVKRYIYRHDPEASEDVGVIAQEIQDVLPEAVFEEEGRYGVNYDQITTVALQGVKEQQVRLDALTTMVDELLADLE